MPVTNATSMTPRDAAQLNFGRGGKGFLINEVTLEKLPFQFNPQEITDSRSVNFEKIQVPGLSHPVLQFIAGDGRQISFILTFSGQGRPDYDVMAKIRWLQSLQYPEWGSGVLKTAVPRVTLVCGALLRIRAVVTQVQVTYQRWSPGFARLLRAEVRVDLEEYVAQSRNMSKVRKGEIDPAIADLVRRVHG